MTFRGKNFMPAKNSASIKHLRIFLPLVFFFVNAYPQTPSAEPEAGEIFVMLEKSETRKTAVALMKTFAAHGLDVNAENADLYPAKPAKSNALDFQLKEYKNLVNYYSNGSQTIYMSEMPFASNAADYWRNWSEALTENRFDYKKFFRDETEMSLLANYNILVLTAHEFGHYFDYRYNLSGWTWDGGFLNTKTEMNCRETTGDIFAAAMIDHLAEREARFAALRARYIALIDEFNRSIPDRNRLVIESYDAIEADCSCIKLESNGAGLDGSGFDFEFFRRYASAYFNRHRLMLESGEFPTLAEYIDRRILEPLYQRRQFTADRVSVATVKTLEPDENLRINLLDLESAAFSLTDEPLTAAADSISQALSIRTINAAGEIRKHRFTSEKRGGFVTRLDAEIRTDDGTKIAATSFDFGADNRTHYFFGKLLNVSDEEFYAVLGEIPAADAAVKNEVKIIRFRRTDGSWNSSIRTFGGLFEEGDYSRFINNFMLAPDGKLYLLTAEQDGRYQKIRLSQLDREDMSVIETETFGVYRDDPADRWITHPLDFETAQLTINNRKRIFFSYSEGVNSDPLIAELGRDGRVRTVAGMRNGITDGDSKHKIRIGWPEELRFLDADTIRFINGNRLRELKLD
jgi:hypothetical protein